MTIYSPENGLSSEKKDLIDDKVTVEVICSEKKGLTDDLHDVPLDTEYPVYNDPVIPIRRQARPVQRRICIQLCLFVGMLAGLSISVLASLYLYRTMSITDLRYRGRCGVGVVNMARFRANRSSSAEPLTDNSDVLIEDVDINGNVETISVPKTDNYNSADITHIFDKNITTIKDLEENRCFLLPLIHDDRLPSPADFHHTLESMDDEILPYYYPEIVSDFAICKGEECYEGTIDDVTELCGEYTPTFTQSAMKLPATNEPSDAPEDYLTTSLLNKLERNFRLYAGGDAVITYHIFSVDTV